MNDEAETTPLTDYALARLRALAQGNGLTPEQISVTASEEKTFIFEGMVRLEPSFDASIQKFGGPVRGKGRQMLPNIQALHAEVDKRKKSFVSRPEWVDEAKAELLKEPGHGWGLTGARVELPKHSVILAATETCPTCRGQKTIKCTKCFGKGYEICIECKGHRQEFCYNCNGSGHNPQVPGQPCVICHGNRYIPCRLCHATGQTACPLCLTKGGTPCPTCKGGGQTTEEITLKCGAVTHFDMKTENLPSSMRRGLDRLGVANLTKGHADVKPVEKKVDEKPTHEEYIPGGLYGVVPSILKNQPHEEADEGEGYGDSGQPTSDGAPKPPDPIVHYEATMPFADVRIDFAGKKAAIGVFGLKRVFLDVPPFLDTSLQPWRTKLEKAWRGHSSPGDALEARAIKEALELQLQGKATVKEFRKIYPVGLSTPVIEEILKGTRKVARRVTLRTRAAAAVIGAGLSAGLFYASFNTPILDTLAAFPKWGIYARYFMPLVLAIGLAYGLISFATHLDLRRRFPETKTVLKQSTGHTALFMVLAIILLWAGILYLAPNHPSWLSIPGIHS